MVEEYDERIERLSNAQALFLALLAQSIHNDEHIAQASGTDWKASNRYCSC